MCSCVNKNDENSNELLTQENIHNDQLKQEDTANASVFCKFVQIELYQKELVSKEEYIPIITLYDDNTFKFLSNEYSGMTTYYGIWLRENNEYTFNIKSFDLSGKKTSIDDIMDEMVSDTEFVIACSDDNGEARLLSGYQIGMSGGNDTRFYVDKTSVEEVNFDRILNDTTINDSIIPYVNVDSSYLGVSQDLLAKNGTMNLYPVKMTPNDMVSGMIDTDVDGIVYYCGHNHDYIGFKDNKVVARVLYGIPSRAFVRNILPTDEFFYTEPYISETDEGFPNFRLYWRINNGYLIIHAVDVGESWLDYKPVCIIHVSDLEQCPYK